MLNRKVMIKLYCLVIPYSLPQGNKNEKVPCEKTEVLFSTVANAYFQVPWKNWYFAFYSSFSEREKKILRVLYFEKQPWSMHKKEMD